MKKIVSERKSFGGEKKPFQQLPNLVEPKAQELVSSMTLSTAELKFSADAESRELELVLVAMFSY